MNDDRLLMRNRSIKSSEYSFRLSTTDKWMNITVGNNWHVLVFEIPIRLIDTVLPYLWYFIESKNDTLNLPHYTIRDKVNQGKSVIISLRLYSKSEITEELVTLRTMVEQKNGIVYLNSEHEKYHAWIKPDEVIQIWTPGRCELLQETSSLAISLMRKQLWVGNEEGSRSHTIHLLSNMLGFEDKIKTDFLLDLVYNR